MREVAPDCGATAGAALFSQTGVAATVMRRLPRQNQTEEFVMSEIPELHGYHVHIYYNDATMPTAAKLRDSLAAKFPVRVGKNQGIAGPHPVPQMQVIFKTDAFDSVVQWLMFNRDGLDILVHPLTNDEYEDHTSQALWLGTPVALKVETLPHGPYPAHLLPAG
jgi:DOPA 4,5-dioxygenase